MISWELWDPVIRLIRYFQNRNQDPDRAPLVSVGTGDRIHYEYGMASMPGGAFGASLPGGAGTYRVSDAEHDFIRSESARVAALLDQLLAGAEQVVEELKTDMEG